MASEIHAVGPQDGPAVWFLNCLSILRAGAEHTAGAFGLVEQIAPVGAGSPYHVHRREDESFFVLEGELEFVSEGRRFTSGAGSFVFLPRNIPHGFRVVGDSPARFLILVNPAGFERFVTEVGEPAVRRELPEPSEPDVPRLVEVAARYGIEILGPLPD